MDIVKRNFGECLKNLRKIKGFTQEQLAEKININLRQLARIEAGESFVTSETIYKLCEVLEIAPWELFNFDVLTECLMTGTDNIVHLNVIKSGDTTHIVSKRKAANTIEQSFDNDISEFDKRMILLSKTLKKEIIIDELEDGKIHTTKKYHPNGNIDLKKANSENEYNILKNKINKIANDREKIIFLNLAFDAITDNSALEELKIFIRGIELSHHSI